MPRKLSISFLGTGGYQSSEYFFPGEFAEQGYETPLVQIAVQRYLQDHEGFSYHDRHILLLTDQAKRENFLAGKKPYGAEVASHEGLKAELEKAGLHAPTKSISVPSGHDRGSIIETFDTIVEEIGEGDELYLDITHGFRSLPMLMLVLANFLRVARQASVKRIFYGAFEDRHANDGRSPIYDLHYLLELQEWSMAAYGYLRYGFVAPLQRLSAVETSPLLQRSKGQHLPAKAVNKILGATADFELQLRTNRGHELYRAAAAEEIRANVVHLGGGSVVERGPIAVLLERIAKKTAALQPNNSLNWLRAARLALDDGLVQQACSLLREGAVSYVCRTNGLNPGVRLDRQMVETALNALGRKLPEDQYESPPGREGDFKRVIECEVVGRIKSRFYKLSPFRNDLMHAGYYTEEGPDNARTGQKIEKEIQAALAEFERILLS